MSWKFQEIHIFSLCLYLLRMFDFHRNLYLSSLFFKEKPSLQCCYSIQPSLWHWFKNLSMACCMAKPGQFSVHPPVWCVIWKAVPTGLGGSSVCNGATQQTWVFFPWSVLLPDLPGPRCALCFCCPPLSAFVKPNSNAMKPDQRVVMLSSVC